MALSDIEAELTSDAVPWRTCAVCHHMAERGEEWADRMRRLLANRSVKFRELARMLATDPDEPTITWDALSRHARAGCAAREQLR